MGKNIYLELAAKVQGICAAHEVCCILNWRTNDLYLPGTGMQCAFGSDYPEAFGIPWGVSLHTPEEARTLRNSKASWLVAGHIYTTSCKPGVQPRGTDFLEAVVAKAGQPVYAIGGITPERVPEVLLAGAKGYCVRSALMTHPEVEALIQAYHVMEKNFRKNNPNQ